MAMLFGCDSFQVGGLVQSGRQALLKKNFPEALGYFEHAAGKDPDYVYTSAHFKEGIWTYVGRSQYVTAGFAAARQSLERALKSARRRLSGAALSRSGVGKKRRLDARFARTAKRIAGALRLDRIHRFEPLFGGVLGSQ
ncbi:MAG: hypothetical protein EXR70_24550 [Deltaproteobacteria bacterium]|nr:hypothetical protein [Deltaproteobacteria bacterium]